MNVITHLLDDRLPIRHPLTRADRPFGAPLPEPVAKETRLRCQSR